MCASVVKRRRRRFPDEVYQAIYRMVREEGITNAAQIHERLVKAFPDTAPTDRTVRTIVRELLPPDPSGEWRPGLDEDPEETARVLEVLARIAPAGPKGEAQWERPTRNLARWIAWVKAGWPDMPPMLAYAVATEFWALAGAAQTLKLAHPPDTSHLEALLAFAPWRSKEAYLWYLFLVNKKRIPPPSDYLLRLADPDFEKKSMPAAMKRRLEEGQKQDER